MATNTDTARSQYENYRFCYENGHEAWVQKAAEAFNFWNSQQWDPRDKARLEREGRPALTLNVIESLVRSMSGIQCALRNDVRFLPTSDANVEMARVQDAVWLSTQQANSFDFLESDAYVKGIIMGRAYYDVRVSFDNSLQGDIVIRPKRSQDVILDHSIDQYDTREWPQVFERRFVSYNDVMHMFGKDAAESIGLKAMPTWYDYEDQFMCQQMGATPYYQHYVTDSKLIRGFILLDRQHKVVKMKEHFIDTETGDLSEIPDNWDRNKIAAMLQRVPGLSTMKRKVMTVRWTITCEDQVLFDEDSPYHDFTTVPYFPMFVDGVTKGIVESLVDPQRMYNKVTSQELHILNTTANSGLIVRAGMVKNMTIREMESYGARTGVVFEVDGPVDEAIKKITPNPIPQGHDRISGKADSIMRSLGGISNQGRGFAREDVASEAILANQAGQEINFALPLNNLHRTKQMLATRVLDCARTHYTTERMLLINKGTALVPNIETVSINQRTPEGDVLNDITKGRYTTTLVPAPTRSTMSEGDFKMLMEMRQLGIMIPDAMLLELSPASNKAQIIQMLQGDSSERQKAADEAARREAEAAAALDSAKVDKEASAAELNRARALKAQIEASKDPDAAYERVESQRMERDERRAQMEMDLDRQKHDQDIALELTKLEQQNQQAEKDRANDRGLAHKQSAQKPGKPGSKKK